MSMKKAAAGDETKVKTCWATMQKYIGNIAQVTHMQPISVRV